MLQAEDKPRIQCYKPRIQGYMGCDCGGPAARASQAGACQRSIRTCRPQPNVESLNRPILGSNIASPQDQRGWQWCARKWSVDGVHDHVAVAYI